MNSNARSYMHVISNIFERFAVTTKKTTELSFPTTTIPPNYPCVIPGICRQHPDNFPTSPFTIVSTRSYPNGSTVESFEQQPHQTAKMTATFAATSMATAPAPTHSHLTNPNPNPNSHSHSHGHEALKKKEIPVPIDLGGISLGTRMTDASMTSNTQSSENENENENENDSNANSSFHYFLGMDQSDSLDSGHSTSTTIGTTATLAPTTSISGGSGGSGDATRERDRDKEREMRDIRDGGQNTMHETNKIQIGKLISCTLLLFYYVYVLIHWCFYLDFLYPLTA